MLGIWMGKDSRDHALGTRGSTGGPGFAESSARNWLPSAATVLAFLRKERGLSRPGNKFQPILRDDVPNSFRPVTEIPQAGQSSRAHEPRRTGRKELSEGDFRNPDVG
ncbi:MAG TPA: hypothetical protein VJV77_05295 [Casimicrobiaceae bacterium]|nr:hypothetical protein [Casimicrobiaceae bacterium]